MLVAVLVVHLAYAQDELNKKRREPFTAHSHTGEFVKGSRRLSRSGLWRYCSSVSQSSMGSITVAVPLETSQSNETRTKKHARTVSRRDCPGVVLLLLKPIGFDSMSVSSS